MNKNSQASWLNLWKYKANRLQTLENFYIEFFHQSSRKKKKKSELELQLKKSNK